MKIKISDGTKISEFEIYSFFSDRYKKEDFEKEINNKNINKDNIESIELYSTRELEIEWGNQFAEYKSLKKISIVSNEKIIVNCYNFQGSMVESVYLNAPQIYFNDGVFVKAEKLKNVSIEGEILSIHHGKYLSEVMFADCINLEKVIGVFRGGFVGVRIFSNCRSLKSPLEIHAKKFGWGVFENCQSLNAIHLHNGLVDMGCEAFKNCVKLEDIYIPDTVEELGRNTFENCQALSSVHIPKTIKIIPQGIFKRCTSLKKCFIPDDVVKIDDSAFEECISLSNPWMPKNLQKIGKRVFYGCQEMREIFIPNSVTDIGEDAFGNCPNLLIRCEKDSFAHNYLEQYNLKFVLN